MDRTKLMEKILEEYDKHGPKDQRYGFQQALLRIRDMDLWAMAVDLGIVTTESEVA